MEIEINLLKKYHPENITNPCRHPKPEGYCYQLVRMFANNGIAPYPKTQTTIDTLITTDAYYCYLLHELCQAD